MSVILFRNSPSGFALGVCRGQVRQTPSANASCHAPGNRPQYSWRRSYCSPVRRALVFPAEQYRLPAAASGGRQETRRVVKCDVARKLIETSLSGINKPGGSYGVALAYLSQFSGDAHRVMIQTSTPLTAYATGQIKANYFEFTPIANLISEPIAFIVRAESPIKTGRDLADRLRADPASVSISLAAARGNAYHIA